MKKKWFIGVIAATIMSMGAGYAAWSQSFTVTNIVKTGELKVAVFEHGTKTKITEVEALDKSGQGVIGFKFDELKATGEGLLTYSTKDGSKIPYLTVQSKLINEEEGIDFILSEAYPGLKLKAQVMFFNKGTLPAVIKAEDIAFSAEGEAKELLDSGMLKFSVTPSHINNKLDLLEVAPGEESPINIEMIISSDLEGYQGKNLAYTMSFLANQGVGVENPADGAETEINKININRIILPFGTEINEETVKAALRKEIQISAGYKLELKDLQINGNSASVRVRVEHSQNPENRDWKNIDISVETAPNTAIEAAAKLNGLSKTIEVTNIEKVNIDNQILAEVKALVGSNYNVKFEKSSYSGSNWKAKVVITSTQNEKEIAEKEVSIVIAIKSMRWNKNTTYKKGDIVHWGTNDIIKYKYTSTTDNNQGNSPVWDIGGYWDKL